MASDASPSTVSVEVAYATPERQEIVRIDAPAGCNVARAIELSGIREHFPDLHLDPNAVGIFSRKVPLDHVLAEGDRVEIYRPLIADPKETRRKRATLPRRQ